VGQWKDFLSLPAPAGQHFHQKLLHLLESLPTLHPVNPALALLSLVLEIFGSQLPFPKRVRSP